MISAPPSLWEAVRCWHLEWDRHHFAHVALKDTHSLLPVTVTPIRQCCFQATMLRCGDVCQCMYSRSPLREQYGSLSLYIFIIPAVHACILPLSRGKSAAKAGTGAGGENTQDFWVPPPCPSLGYTGEDSAGWHDKGGNRGLGENKRDRGWF